MAVLIECKHCLALLCIGCFCIPCKYSGGLFWNTAMLLANGSIGLGLAGKVGRTRSMFPRAKLFSTTEARFSEYPAHSLFSSAEGNKNSSRPCVSFKFVSFNPPLWFPLPNCNDFLMPHAGQFSAESLRESP